MDVVTVVASIYFGAPKVRTQHFIWVMYLEDNIIVLSASRSIVSRWEDRNRNVRPETVFQLHSWQCFALGKLLETLRVKFKNGVSRFQDVVWIFVLVYWRLKF